MNATTALSEPHLRAVARADSGTGTHRAMHSDRSSLARLRRVVGLAQTQDPIGPGRAPALITPRCWVQLHQGPDADDIDTSPPAPTCGTAVSSFGPGPPRRPGPTSCTTGGGNMHQRQEIPPAPGKRGDSGSTRRGVLITDAGGDVLHQQLRWAHHRLPLPVVSVKTPAILRSTTAGMGILQRLCHFAEQDIWNGSRDWRKAAGICPQWLHVSRETRWGP